MWLLFGLNNKHGYDNNNHVFVIGPVILFQKDTKGHLLSM